MTQPVESTSYSYCCTTTVYREAQSSHSSDSGQPGLLDFAVTQPIITGENVYSPIGTYGYTILSIPITPKKLSEITASAGKAPAEFAVPSRGELKEELDNWLKLSSSAFDFWDNDEDAIYDDL